MATIKLLDSLTINQIAAGEVVEKPASVVKELVENALDANTSVISVSIQNGGISSIQVVDNGIGMSSEDLEMAFKSHTTSKLSSVEDFNRIKTLGFRGEALASIAAVSRIRIRTKQPGETIGSRLELEAGEVLSYGDIQSADGTGITVESLFFNTPARYKFLKKDATEASYIADIMERFVLARPDVSFIFNNNSQEMIHSPGNNDLKSAIYSVYGKKITNALIALDYQNEDLHISGFVGKPEISRNNRKQQSVFVNKRFVKSTTVTAAVEEAYKTLLMKGKYPFYVINIEVNPMRIDVNVHPQKTQIKFWNENEVFRTIYHAVLDVITEDEKIAPTILPTPAVQVSLGESKPLVDMHPDPNPDPITPSTPVKPLASQTEYTSKKSEPTMMEIAEESPRFSSMRYIGAIFETYQLFESGDEMVLIDQHAAHERILFERLYQQRASGDERLLSQSLLAPEIIEMTVNEVLILQENQAFLRSMGFECEEYGAKSVLLRGIPLNEMLLNPVAALKAVVDTLSKQQASQEDQINESLYSIACKAAVKAHDKLSVQEVESLLQGMEQTDRSSHCPHGRPSILKIPRKEIEKWFKRIVH